MITKEEVQQFSKQLQNGYGFKDQPSGFCKACKWDNGTCMDFSCEIPVCHLTNLICIQKRMLVSIESVDAEDDED